MDNVIEFPWFKNRGGTLFDYNDRFNVQKELYLENFLNLAAQVLEVTNVMPDTLIRVVDQEKPGITLSCYSGWLLTMESSNVQRVQAYGSNEPVSTYESYSGLAITPEYKLFEYRAVDEYLKKGEVIHFCGRLLVDEIPDRYIQSRADMSSELIFSLAKINTVAPKYYGSFPGLSSVK